MSEFKLGKILGRWDLVFIFYNIMEEENDW